MKITSIDHRLLDFEDGLPPIHLQNLSRVVVLAGPNGSGKTRMIRRIELCGEQSRNFMGKAKIPMAWLKDLQKAGKVRTIHDLNDQFDTQTAPRIGVDFDPLPDFDATGDIASLTFTDAPLVASGKIALDDIERATSLYVAGGATQIMELAVHYLYAVQGAWWDATHQATKRDAEAVQAAIAAYKALQSVVSKLLGRELDRDVSGNPTLFGRPVTAVGLSHGQIALLRWAVALHAQGDEPGETVITIDEPENHLHPDGMIEAVNRLIDVNKDGQVWIATHSVPLIAALHSRYPDDLSLYFMVDGTPTYAGKAPEQILMSLMGGEANLAALRQFIDLPELLAVNRFAAECLMPPGVVAEVGGNDPQVAVAHSAISGCDKFPIRVLDFGAGHGRLLEGLTSLLGEDVGAKLDYVAWDISESPSSQCVGALRAAYGKPDDRWFCDRNKLFEKRDPGSFQVAVMCNVFHEIDPLEWPGLFDETSELSRALDIDGSLVIVEDYLMPKGEYAHPFGFTLLDTEAIKVLFQAGAGESKITVLNADGRYADRIKAHIVPARLLKNVTAATRREAIQLAARNAESHILKLRAGGAADFRSGQAHAFWVQQFANCTIALKNL